MEIHKVIPPPPEYLEWLRPYPQSIQELALTIRNFVIQRAPYANEFVADGVGSVAMGLGYTRSYWDNFVHVPAFSKHVNLGFDYGINLDDPEARLIGEGVRVRHVKIFSAADLAEPYVDFLFTQAHANARRPSEPQPRETILLRYENAKKRRPS